ncbi:MAG: beta-ketoacyl synthase [Rubripirellula sp.]
MPQSNVVITGVGVVSPIGIGCDAFWDSMSSMRSGIRSLAERTDDGPQPTGGSTPEGLWIGGPILDFDPKQYVRPRKALKVMCREIQISFAASQLAVEHAGLSDSFPATVGGAVEPKDVGTVFGSEMFYGPPSEMEDAVRACMNEQGEIDASLFGGMAQKNIMPLWMLKYLPNMPACHVGISLNAHGPNNTQVLGDVSAFAATTEAASCIERGIAKVVFAGATGTRIGATRLNYRGDLPIASVHDPVELSSRPHDPQSQGVVGAEGAGTIVLECAEHAKQRNHIPLARIASYAARFVSPNSQRGSATAIQLAIEAAMKDAEVSADQIGLVVSHAMGDPQIDAAERAALSSTLPGRPVVAPIALVGHTGAACGSIGLATAAMALHSQTVPPTPRTKTTEDVGFSDKAAPMQGEFALALSHTSQGNAIAILLKA